MKIKQFLKKNRVVIIGLLLLVVFGVLGQVIKKNKADVNNDSENGSVERSSETENHLSDDFLEHVEIEGVSDTQDNPWGKTAGIFDMEDIGKCIFLTPNTGFQVKDLSEDLTTVSLKAKIHPWMVEYTDGAGLVVWYLDSEGEILHEDTVSVAISDEWTMFSFDIVQYENADTVKIMCNNGENNDDSGDWVIVKQF